MVYLNQKFSAWIIIASNLYVHWLTATYKTDGRKMINNMLYTIFQAKDIQQMLQNVCNIKSD